MSGYGYTPDPRKMGIGWTGILVKYPTFRQMSGIFVGYGYRVLPRVHNPGRDAAGPIGVEKGGDSVSVINSKCNSGSSHVRHSQFDTPLDHY